MIHISGQNLQRRYSNVAKSDLSTNTQKQQAKNDREALGKVAKARRQAREEAQERRMQKNPKVALETLEKKPESLVEVKQIVKKAKEQTGVLARKHGLVAPNNPEALAHDRLHCFTCDRKLDNPNAHKNMDDFDGLFKDEEVRIMCCWCFGKMSDSEIKSTMYTGEEASAEIRLKVYNPEESTKAEIESLIDSKRIQLKSKLKRWEQDTSLVGKVKHDYLEEGDYMENKVLYDCKGIYSCTL